MARTETIKTVQKLMMKVLVCQGEEFGFFSCRQKGAKRCFSAGKHHVQLSFSAEQRMNWSRETQVAGN